MNHAASSSLRNFNNLVALKFQLYNSLFTSLPFYGIEKTGMLLSLFINHCDEGFEKGKSPTEIVENFFSSQVNFQNQKEKMSLLFRFIQYIERQVVLFDALEDAAFAEVTDMGGKGTLKHLEMQVGQNKKEKELTDKLKRFSVQLVLTAHPTQFYPGQVLGIINDLSKSLATNNTPLINMYLQQLGKTPFLQKEKPTPYNEAMSLIWFLENTFFPAAGRIISFLKSQFNDAVDDNNPIVKMGFWPGGDRDGNPFVNTDITLKVADALRGSIIKCYYLEIRKLRRRLTFKGVEEQLMALEEQLYQNIFRPENKTNLEKKEILQVLKKIKETIIFQHNGLFLHLIENLINKVHVFGLHFASLDIRQDSSIHKKVFEAIATADNDFPKDYMDMPDHKKIAFLSKYEEVLPETDYGDAIINDTLESIKAIKEIQKNNGEPGCNRYIISHSETALNVIEVFALFKMCGWEKEAMTIDIVPLIETIEDLKNAPSILSMLYKNKDYLKHLKRRNKTQTIMLGFSDGTKDGGYLMGNWSIYKAKEQLTSVSKEYGINVVFFDGRGGPPARGGGKTHKFYASMGKNIANEEIQLTVQGQTVSSNFGTIDSAQYNLEQLIHAGISNELFSTKETTFEPEDEALIERLAGESLKAYSALKNHPDFMDYLTQISPLTYYSKTNIGSRPSKRGSGKMTLEDLRAVPFVGSWSQLKQNVTGFYGVGSALQKMNETGDFSSLKKLYQNSLFFKTLIDNCEMAMKKCFFPLTQYLANDKQFGEMWNMIYGEYLLTEKYLFRLTTKSELMADYPVEQVSVGMREKIVLPLLTIQQFAMANIRKLEINSDEDPLKATYEKLVMRCSFGIINAGRNSA